MKASKFHFNDNPPAPYFGVAADDPRGPIIARAKVSSCA